MFDPAQAHDTGVAITTSAPGMITLRGALEDTAFKAAVKEVSGLTVPEPREIVQSGEHRLAWMGPDEALLILPRDALRDTVDALVTALKGHHALVADMSDARRLFHLTGPDAALRDTLARLCPVDMRAFQLGEIRRTRLAQIAAAFWMGEEGRLDLICFRSVAQYAEDLLSDAAGKGVVLR